MSARFIVAGIVNITPDSFSDGGQFFHPEAALLRVGQHVDAGADCIDLGAESTRPGAESIGSAEELKRLLPVLRGALELKSTRGRFAISVDTFRAETARVVLEEGADIINDVSGAVLEPELVEILAAYKPGYVLGHCPVLPERMSRHAHYDNIVDSIMASWHHQMNLLVTAGLPEDNICFDPCIGFAQTPLHAMHIFSQIDRLHSLGRPLYFGISRKSCIGAVTGEPIEERFTSTQAMVAYLAAKGVQIHRVHDVSQTKKTLALAESMRSGVLCPL